MKNIIIPGAPGLGRGTQSDRLIAKYDLGHISTGDMLRGEVENDAEPGKTTKAYIDRGQLIPDKLIIDTLASMYNSFGKGHKGVILGNFPHTIPQAEALKQMLADRDHCVAATIELDMPEDELTKRLILRRRESGRTDDNEETIKKRSNVYRSQTVPLIEWYKKEGIHHRISGLGELEGITKDTTSGVDKLQTLIYTSCQSFKRSLI